MSSGSHMTDMEVDTARCWWLVAAVRKTALLDIGTGYIE